MGIVKSLFRRGGHANTHMGNGPKAAHNTPHLFMLTPDAAGIAAYQISQYATAQEAEAYLDEHLRGEIREGTIVFWGLTWLPAPSDDGDMVEPVVLIRDIRRQGQVYTFSFADVGSAYDFIRHEMKAGLDLGQVSIYWALQARIMVDFWGRATIVPPNPPRRARMQIVARRDADAPAAVVAEPVAEEKAPPVAAEPITAAEHATEKGLDEEDLEKVVRILDSRGMRPAAEEETPVEAKTEPEEVIEVEEKPVETPDEAKPVEDESIHVQLSDVYGGPTRVVRKTGREALNGLGDYGREHEIPEAFRAEGEPAVEEIAAPRAAEEKESGIMAAWANICFALDRAIDVHVARQVVATIVWRRLSIALAEAAEASYISKARAAWASGADALAFAANIQDEKNRAMATAWHNSARALRRAAEMQTGRRQLRHAWLNISWTLEEAALAYNLERKTRVIKAWAVMGPALAEAAHQKDAMDRGMRTAWRNAAEIALAAAETQMSHHQGLVSAWDAAGKALYDAGVEVFRQRRVEAAWRASGDALFKAVETKQRHDGMISAWRTLTIEFLAAAEVQEARRLGLILAWHAIGDAAFDGVAAMYRHRRVTVAMENAGLALHEAVAMKIYHEAMAATWARMTEAFANAVDQMGRIAGLKTAWKVLALELLSAADMQVAREAAAVVWGQITIVLYEAADAKIRYEGLVFAWQATGEALKDYAVTKQHHEALIDAWDAIGVALHDGSIAKVRHDALVKAWRNAARAFRNAAQAYFVRQMSYRRSWESLSEAIATAAHAKVVLDGQIAAWDAACDAIVDAVEARLYHEMLVRSWNGFAAAIREAMPEYLRDLGLKSTWGRAARSLREAAVAEAQLRIAEASGDDDLLAEVKSAILKAKGAKTADATSKAADVAELKNEKPKTTRKRARRTSAKKKADKKEVEEVKATEETKVEEKEHETAETKFGDEVPEEGSKDEIVDDKAAIELWRFRENGRFESRDEVFHGFESPPGRF